MKRALDKLCFDYDINEMLQYLKKHPRFGDDAILKTVRRYYKNAKNCEYDSDYDCFLVNHKKTEFYLHRPKYINYQAANDAAAAQALFRVYDNYQKFPIWATQQQVFTLILCLKRLNIHKDIIYCITKMLWDTRYQN